MNTNIFLEEMIEPQHPKKKKKQKAKAKEENETSKQGSPISNTIS